MNRSKRDSKMSMLLYNLYLHIDKEYEKYLISSHRLFDGVHYLFRFDNNYGASVVKHNGSYGHNSDLWELAVIKFRGTDPNNYDIVYNTDIANDVIGFLTDEEVNLYLYDIDELEKESLKGE